jgi:hypothetical protein
MGNYMTFIYDAKAISELLAKEPDYLLFNVGYRLITDPEDAKKQLAVLTTDAEAFKNGEKDPLAQTLGCPVPPCKPGGSGG